MPTISILMVTLDKCRRALGHVDDYAMDIGGTGQSFIRLDYAGYDSGYSPAIKLNTPVYLTLYVEERSNFSGTNAACHWTKYRVQARYTNTLNQTATYHVGHIYLAHLYNWQQSVGTTIPWNAIRANANGTGSVYYPNVWVGDVYPSGDGVGGAACSTGAHSHLGVYSKRNWGAQYEWHGQGPDYFWDYDVHGPGNPSTAYSTPPSGIWNLLTPTDSRPHRRATRGLHRWWAGNLHSLGQSPLQRPLAAVGRRWPKAQRFSSLVEVATGPDRSGCHGCREHRSVPSHKFTDFGP